MASSGIWRLGLFIGVAVVLVDWVIGTLMRALPPADPLLAPLVLVDLAANVALFVLGGYLGFQATLAVRAGAEVGVIAGALAGAVASLRTALAPLPGEPAPGSADLIGLLALNVAMGGMLGLAGAALARARGRAGKNED